jgi:4'-phosphopantetheinyl transferase EntD
VVARAHGLVIFGVGFEEGQPQVEEALAYLHPREQALAMSQGAAARAGFIAGRVALRRALQTFGLDADEPLLRTSEGAPAVPRGLTGSVTHKGGVALAVGALMRDGRLGIDLEIVGRALRRLAPRVLAPEELSQVGARPHGERWRETLVRFSAKEALYKSLKAADQHEINYGNVMITHVPSLRSGFRRLVVRFQPERRASSEIWCHARDGWIVSIARTSDRRPPTRR